jgi:hypothetical protein
MSRCFRNHRGVKVYRVKEIIVGSDYDICPETGAVKDRKPCFDVWFMFQGSAKYDSVEEIRKGIDMLIELSLESFPEMTEKEVVEVLNETPEGEFCLD